MTSQRKIESNRRNAKRSTGPKTSGGKTISSRNALKHGLASAAVPPRSEAVKEFIAYLSKDDQQEPARIIAQTTACITHVRALCDQELFAGINGQKPLNLALKEVERLRRYEKRALSQRRKAMKRLQLAEAANPAE